MPEKDISREQSERVKKWVEDNGGEEYADDIEHEVWKVDGELLGLETIVKGGRLYMRLGNREFGGRETFRVTYTEAQERAGLGNIVNNGYEHQQGVQTPEP